MHDLRTTNAENDFQNFRIGSFLRHRGVKAGAALLDEGEVKPSGKGDRFHVIARIFWIVAAEIIGVARNRGMQTGRETWDGVGKRRAQIRIRGAAVASPPAGINGQLSEIGESSDLLRSRGCAARQRSESVQVNGRSAFGDEIGVKKINVTLLVVGVV